MAANSNPIFTRIGDIQGGVLLQTQASVDFAGTNTNVVPVFTADLTNGGYIQRLRFKADAGGANVATVARIWINEGVLNQKSLLGATTFGTITTSSGSGGTLQTSTYYAKVQGIDQYGGLGTISAESAVQYIGVSGTGNITWTWNILPGASSYRLYVGPAPAGEYAYFNTATTSYLQTVPYIAGQLANPADYVVNNMFYGEVSLPATAAATASALTEIDYPLNLALPPGYRILVGLGTTVVSGWYVTAVGGKY
jgi:hypothetical protein